jgi:hypothetical protein
VSGRIGCLLCILEPVMRKCSKNSEKASLMSLSAAAREAHLSRRRINQLIRCNALSAVKLENGRFLVRRSELMAVTQ